MKTELYRYRRPILVILFLGLLVAGLLLDLNAGYASIPIGELFTGNIILLELRLPRVLACALVGAGLSLSGAILQGVTRNDMAEPGILGINAGSGLLIALFILLFQGGKMSYSLMMPLLSFAGAGLTFFVEYRLAYSNGRLHRKRLLLIGVAISLAINAINTIIMLRMPDSQYAFVQNWLAGSLWGADWPNVCMLAAGILVCGSLAFYHARTLNALMLGRDSAIGIGVDVNRQSRFLIILAIALCSFCASIGGGLSFIGLVAPHLARRLIGSNATRLLPFCALVGAVLMVYADIVSRTWFLPFEMPVGITVAVIGAPYFLYLLVKE